MLMATATRTYQWCGFANLGCFLPKSNSFKGTVFIITTVKISLLTAKDERSLVRCGAAGSHTLLRLCRDRPRAAALSFSVFSLHRMVSLDSAVILEILMSHFLQIKLEWSVGTHFCFSLRKGRLRCLHVA